MNTFHVIWNFIGLEMQPNHVLLQRSTITFKKRREDDACVVCKKISLYHFEFLALSRCRTLAPFTMYFIIALTPLANLFAYNSLRV